MRRSAAEIVREYGPFPGVDQVHGVTYDGRHVWFASGDKINAFDPASGKTVRSLDVTGHAGTAFDGQHLFQIAEDRIQKIDPKTGRVLATIPAPGGGGDSGLAWAEGTLWVGQHRGRKIHQVDPETGAVLRTIETNRVVTGVTWIDGELWHGTWEGDESDLRRIDPRTGEVLERLDMPPGTGDAQLTLTQLVPLRGAITVTTPQNVALYDVCKGIMMFQKVNVPLLGLIENMSHFVCGHCGEKTEIFSYGGGERAAQAMGIPFLGRVPIDPAIRTGGDSGLPIVVGHPDSPQTQAFLDIARKIREEVEEAQPTAAPPLESLLKKIKAPFGKG